MITEKRCSKCGETKPIEMFDGDITKLCGFSAHCKYCRGIYRKTRLKNETLDERKIRLEKNRKIQYGYRHNLSPDKRFILLEKQKIYNYTYNHPKDENKIKHIHELWKKHRNNPLVKERARLREQKRRYNIDTREKFLEHNRFLEYSRNHIVFDGKLERLEEKSI